MGWIPDTFKTCTDCVTARAWFMEKVKDFCWAHGNTWEDMQNWANDGVLTQPGDNMRFGRMLVKKRGRFVPRHKITG